MSISGISSSSSSYQTSNTQSTAAIKALLERLNAQSSSSSGSSSSSDTVTISVEALQSLLQSQQDGGMPPMTDDQAAKMGEDIKQQNSDLFTQLDADEDGVLSADEAEAGKDAIGQAIKDGSLKPPEKPEMAGGAGAPPAEESSTDELIVQLIAALSKQGLSNTEIAEKLGTTEQKVQESLQDS